MKIKLAVIGGGSVNWMRGLMRDVYTLEGVEGGYIFTTSNVPFKEMPPERYTMILDIWKSVRKY